MEINYWRASLNGPEVNFVVREGTEVKALIQVVHTLTPENEGREVGALLKASRRFRNRNLLIITWDQEDTVRVGNRAVRVIPFHEWVLRNQPGSTPAK